MADNIFDAFAESSGVPEDYYNPSDKPLFQDPPTRRRASEPSLADFVAAERAAPEFQHALSTSTTDAEKVNRFRNSRIFSNDLNPNGDNELYAAQNQSVWDALGSGWEGFKDNFWDSAKEGAYSWVRLGKAIMNFDLDEFTPNAFELESAAASERERMSRNAIYNDPYTDSDDGIFTRQFAAESLQNLGFAVGTAAELGLELGAEALIGAAFALPTAGASAVAAGTAAGASVAARTSGMIEKVTNLVQKAFRATSKVGDDALRMGTGIVEGEANVLRASKYRLLAEEAARHNRGIAASLKSGNFMNAALNIAERLPFAGEVVSTGRLIRAGSKVGLDAKDLIKIGRGGVRRAFGEWQMASSEAAIEAGSNYGQTYDKMYNDYLDKHGVDPSTEEQMRMRTLAQQSALSDFGANVAVLGVMNKLQFGNLFSKFLPDAAMARAFKGEVERGFIVSGMNHAGTEQLTKAYGKGFLGRVGILPQVYKDFGRKTATWEAAKALGAGLSRFEIAEGVQELIQEGSSAGITDYYADLYSLGQASWGDSLEEAVDSQSNFQGFKTFLSGVLTGVPMHVGTKAVERAVEATGYQKEQRQAAQQADKESIDQLNTFFSNPLFREDAIGEYVKHIKKQTVANQNMAEAAANGDRYVYENNRSSALANVVMHAKRLGSFDGLMEYVSGHMDGMTPEDFEEAYGFKVEQSGFDSPEAFAHNIAKNLKQYNEVYEKNLAKFDQYFRLADFVSDQHRAQRMQFTRAALMDAIETVAFQEMQVIDTTQRAAQILRNINRFPTLGSSLSASFHTLTDHENFTESLTILGNEIKTLEEVIAQGGDPKAKQLLAEKVEEYAALNEWLDAIGFTEHRSEGTHVVSLQADQVIKNTNTRKAAVTALARYLTIKNKQGGIRTQVNEKEVDEALGEIVDFLKLTGQQHEHVNALNALSDPETFMNTFAKLTDARIGAYARQLVDYYELLGESTEDADVKDLLDQNQDKVEELRKFARAPYHSTSNYERIKTFQEKFAQALQDLKAQKAAPQPEPNIAPASAPQVAPVQAPSSAPVVAPAPSGTLLTVSGIDFNKGDYITLSGKPYRIEGLFPDNGINYLVILREDELGKAKSDQSTNRIHPDKIAEKLVNGSLQYLSAADYQALKANPAPSTSAITPTSQTVPGGFDLSRGVLDDNGKLRKDIKKAIDAKYFESPSADGGWFRRVNGKMTHDENNFKGLPDFGKPVPLATNSRYKFFAEFENKLTAAETTQATSQEVPQTPGEAATPDEQAIVDLKEQLRAFTGKRVSRLVNGRVIEGQLLISTELEKGLFLIRDERGSDSILEGSKADSRLSEYGLTPIQALPAAVQEQAEPQLVTQMMLNIQGQPVQLQIVNAHGPGRIDILLNGQFYRVVTSAMNSTQNLRGFDENGKLVNYTGGIYDEYLTALKALPYFKMNGLTGEQINQAVSSLQAALQSNPQWAEHAAAINTEVLDSLLTDSYVELMSKLPIATPSTFTAQRIEDGINALKAAIAELRNFVYIETNESLMDEFHKNLTTLQRLLDQQQTAQETTPTRVQELAPQVAPEVVQESTPVRAPAQSGVVLGIQDDVTGETVIKASWGQGDRYIVIKDDKLDRVYLLDDDRKITVPVEPDDEADVAKHVKRKQVEQERSVLFKELRGEEGFGQMLQTLADQFGNPPSFDLLVRKVKEPMWTFSLLNHYLDPGETIHLTAEQTRFAHQQLKQLAQQTPETPAEVVPSPAKPEANESVKPRPDARTIPRRTEGNAETSLPESASASPAETGDVGQSGQPVSQSEPEPIGSAVENRRRQQARKVKKASRAEQPFLDGIETTRHFTPFNAEVFKTEIQEGLAEILSLAEVTHPVKRSTKRSTKSEESLDKSTKRPNFKVDESSSPATSNPFDALVEQLACHR